MSDLVVKSNRLNVATQNLSLTEIRIMQLAIIDARETGKGLSTDEPLVISASRYAEAFNVSRQTAHEAILSAEKTLFDRRFSFIDFDSKLVKARWIQRVKYLDDQASIAVILTYDVVNEITRIDGYEKFFTQYLLKQTAGLKSAYSVRLYELLIQWKTAKKTPVFELGQFREQLGVGSNEYKLMSDFKKRVLITAIDEINELTDLKVSYEQEKTGRKITGFKFKVLEKPKPKKDSNQDIKEQNGDLFTIDGLSDEQLGRVTRSPSFIKDYADRVAPNSAENRDMQMWTAHFVQELKKDASKFNKRPIKDYLNY